MGSKLTTCSYTSATSSLCSRNDSFEYFMGMRFKTLAFGFIWSANIPNGDYCVFECRIETCSTNIVFDI